MPENRPQGRERKVAGQGAGVYRRGEGLGTGPVGTGSSPTGQRPQQTQQSGGTRASGGRSPLLLIIIVAAVLIFGGGGGLSALFGGGSSDTGTASSQTGTGSYDTLLPGSSTQTDSGSGSSTKPGYSQGLTGLLTGGGNSWTGASSGTSSWTGTSNTGTLDRSVSSKAREKYTKIIGGGADQVTVMVYICGTDLESRSGMASRDLSEMAKATLSDRLNVVVCTGGCKQWQVRGISTQNNEIWELKDGGLNRTGADAGSGSMTDPNTLLSFIRYAAENYPANRYELILWDHGGGSISGYGYDEKYQRSGSMSLASLSSALKASGLKFDFIGFDACLMATVENAAMLSAYADYMIASEETEPGVGWYYTNWLTTLAANTSTPTLDIGKIIVDDFVSYCSRNCAGQPTTLSLVDLAELGQTLPADMKAFSTELKGRIADDYQSVSTARGYSKEFASSTKIDQIDFIDFAGRIGSEEGDALVETLRSAVKYNRTGSGVTNAYGLSVYFPLKKLSTVDKAVQAYDAMGMDESYTDCIRAFASMEAGGQAAAGGSTVNPYASLMGNYTSSSSSAASGYGDISGLLNAALSGDLSSLLGLGSSDFFSGRAIPDTEAAALYLNDNRFDPSLLFWQRNADGDYVISMDERQWSLTQDVLLNLFYDDGEGYVDLGLDNYFSFDANGNLLPDTSGAWVSINSQPVAYYYMSSEIGEDGAEIMRGYVPAMLNGEQVRLILIFDGEHPDGYVAGAEPAYAEGETETLSRGLIELLDGDVLDFLCDFYSYSGEYRDSYYLGEPLTVQGELTVSNTYLGGPVRILYRFTDIYQQHYWSEALPD